jgi:hypothetical protein
MLNLVNPGQRRKLSEKARKILRPVFAARFPYVDLDAVRLRLGSRFPGIPAHPIGMALGSTIYLKQHTLDECDLGEMLLLLHELVHVGQYHDATRIGFAGRYGYSIMLHLGNDQNQLEWEAYQFVAASQTAVWQAIRAVCEHRRPGDAGSPV